MVPGILVRFLLCKTMFRTIVSGRYAPRAVLVLAALISLCVSNNVGLSFLPLHGSGGYVSEIGQENPNATALGSRSPVESDSSRVPIMSQKRGDKEPESQSGAAILNSGLLFPSHSRFLVEQPSRSFLCLSEDVSQPPGRAPPRLA